METMTQVIAMMVVAVMTTMRMTTVLMIAAIAMVIVVAKMVKKVMMVVVIMIVPTQALTAVASLKDYLGEYSTCVSDLSSDDSILSQDDVVDCYGQVFGPNPTHELGPLTQNAPTSPASNMPGFENMPSALQQPGDQQQQMQPLKSNSATRWTTTTNSTATIVSCSRRSTCSL